MSSNIQTVCFQKLFNFEIRIFSGKDKQCRAYGWDSDVQICGSYQIIQNQNILPRYSSKPKDGWYADIQSRFVDSERSMPYYYALVSLCLF